MKKNRKQEEKTQQKFPIDISLLQYHNGVSTYSHVVHAG